MAVETMQTLPSELITPSEEEVAELEKLMSAGKRNFICNQHHLALECFVELCEKLAKFYGQESDQCVEAYLYYGKTLLEIARLENGVLGHAIKEAPVFGSADEVNETEEDNEIADIGVGDTKTENVDAESSTECNKDSDVNVEANGSESNLSKTSNEKETSEVPDTDKTIEQNTVGNGDQSDGSDVDNEDDEEEDISNMELSWQMFELTVVICSRQLKEGLKDSKKVKMNLAEAKYGLGQISQETERYEEAVKDFTECLNLYKEILEDKNDRKIAEAHYNIAISLSFDTKYPEALEQFENAVTVLKGRIAELEKKIKEAESKGGKEKASAELEGWQKEINELNDLILLDLTAKIEDAHESKKLLDEAIKNVKNVAIEIFGPLSGKKNDFDNGFDDGFDAPLTANTEVVNDISNKIRSTKRKSDDENSNTPDKKIRAAVDISDIAKVTANSEE